MRKNALKMISFILTIAFVTGLTGCVGEKEEGSSQTGKAADEGFFGYQVETLSDAFEDKKIWAGKLNSNGEMVVYINNESPEYIILDEKGNIQKTIKCDFKGEGAHFAFDQNNYLYIIGEAYERNQQNKVEMIKHQLIVYDKEGNKIREEQPVEIRLSSNDDYRDHRIRDVAIDSRGKIYAVKGSGKIELMDQNGHVLKTIGDYGCDAIEIDEEDHIIAGIIREHKIEAINPENGEVIGSQTYDDDTMPYLMKYNRNKKALYGLNEKGVYKYDMVNKSIEKILDYREYTAVDSVLDFEVGDKNIYGFILRGDNVKLLRYSKVTEAKAKRMKSRKEIVLSTPKYDLQLLNAARQFEESHPDIRINIQEHSSLDYQEYLDALNSEMTAGKGPDIICDSFFPAKSDMEKNLLVNFDELIKGDEAFNINDYNVNIINSLRYKEGLYTIPITYAFNVIVANENLLKEKSIEIEDKNWTWQDFYRISKEICREDSSQKCYALPKPSRWPLILYDIDYYIDSETKKAHFDSEEFIDVLKLYKAIGREDIIHPTVEGFDLPRSDEKDTIAFVREAIYGYWDIFRLKSYFDGPLKLLALPIGHSGSKRGIDYGKFCSVNNNSKYKEEAWEFIKFLISEEVQLVENGQRAFQINNRASQGAKDYVIAYQEDRKDNLLNDQGYNVLTQSDFEQVHRVMGYINGCNSNYFNNRKMVALIAEEIKPFINEERSAEETTKAIQNQVNLYLKE
ncbi:MAG: extracellular solute-binding protein [Firmicutes bacterium]|nr:extracellular solute-binding protein [Bacillota bacterium]